ncbi:MAG: flagellar protein FlgN [Phycisphaerales bacterium]|nr:flagellar protein FlgN [Phycisphaerales bacterium]
MKSPSSTAKTTSPIDSAPSIADFDKLDGVLRELLSEHERLLALAKEHQRAIATADIAGLTQCMTAQGEVIQRVAALEKLRQALVGRIAAATPAVATAGNAKTLTISMLALRAPAPVRDRLTAVAAALRDLLNTLHREHQAMRQAAETLSTHMEGLMRQVCRRLSHAGTYARGGGFDASVQVVSSLDVRS